jgi:hypothetical protein
MGQIPLLLRPFIGLFNQHWMIDGDDWEAISGMNEWQGNRGTRGKPPPITLSPLHVQRDLICDRTRANAMGIRRQTALAKAQTK